MVFIRVSACSLSSPSFEQVQTCGTKFKKVTFHEFLITNKL